MKIALIGNPNSGKTTLFNVLTGSSAHVGNWPGVTIEKKEGTYRNKSVGEKVEIVDLPGIYSLSPYTPEEIISRNYLLSEKPDAVINIVDATNIERNLYLTTQVMEIDVPVVIALNMMDAVEKSGGAVNASGLSDKIGVPVVSISALKNKGIQDLMSVVLEQTKRPRKGTTVLEKSPIFGLVKEISDKLKKNNADNIYFNSIKVIEADELANEKFKDLTDSVNKIKEKYIDADFDGDFEAQVADLRYRYISDNFAEFVSRKKEYASFTKSDKADKVLTHKIWGIPIFFLIMFGVFHITFSGNFLFLGLFGVEPINSPGVLLQEGLGWVMGEFIGLVAGWLSSSPEWVSGLICDGLLGGLDAVLSFFPQIMLLFLFLSIMEDTGYIARVAFIMDRAFRKFGLSGKAFMPLLMCFGCAVPGIMATRTLENAKERRLATMIAPFFSCGAKLPIWAMFAVTVFAGSAGEFLVFGIYILGIAVAIISAIILNKTLLKGETPPFIMELPSYHSPKVRNTAAYLWSKLKHYLVRAGTIIAAAVIVIWLLSNLSFSFNFVEDGKDSILGTLGRGLSWMFVPLGFGAGDDGWMFVVAVFTGLLAKEVVVATLGVFSGMDPEAEIVAGAPIAVLLGTLSVPAALAFMAFNLLSVPCMAAVGAAHGEMGQKKHTFISIAFWIITAYTVSLIIYWVGTFWWIGLILAAFAIAAVAFCMIRKRKKQS